MQHFAIWKREYDNTVQMHLLVMHGTAKLDERNYPKKEFESRWLWRKTQKEIPMRILFGLAIVTTAVLIAWSVEPTVGKTPTVSLDPHGMMVNTTNLPQSHYDDYSTIY